MIHIGSLIEKKLREQGRTVTWFAAALHCDRTNVYKIFQKSSIDSSMLYRISCILGYDFFRNIPSLSIRV
ncbi:XRE family transcriptional regulator [Barnesiella intestinihominis]|uniref:XRE family transcriptional regulator n=1 Tax=Barnesiella intestinihominis TaxID=487174 RepID=UPI00267131C8|nr:XRE family transcriptional regulator [Barnesiella intestinihominis]